MNGSSGSRYVAKCEAQTEAITAATAMNAMIRFIIVSIAIGFTASRLCSTDSTNISRASIRPELEYLKVVNEAAPPKDPQLLFLLMAQYASANKRAEGAEFFSARFKEFEPRLTSPQKALY